MRYNDNQIDVELIGDVEPSGEPVTLVMAKRHLNLQFDTSGSYDFSDDDAYLNDLIPQCREAVEQYTGLSLGEKALKAIVRNELGEVEIPYGPVTDVFAVKDKDGATVTAVIRGNQFKWIESPCSCYLSVEYTAGYGETYPIPKGLVRAILEEIAFRYQHRGDELNQYSDQKMGICQGAIELATPYKRKPFLV